MQAEKDEKQQLKDKCEQLDSALEFKINQKRAELSSIENELSKLNPKDPEYQAKSDEKSKLESELDGLHDERSNNKKELADYDDAIKSLDADITSSTAQHTAKDNELNGPDGKHDKINSLENKNKDLSKHLEENGAVEQKRENTRALQTSRITTTATTNTTKPTSSNSTKSITKSTNSKITRKSSGRCCSCSISTSRGKNSIN